MPECVHCGAEVVRWRLVEQHGVWWVLPGEAESEVAACCLARDPDGPMDHEVEADEGN